MSYVTDYANYWGWCGLFQRPLESNYADLRWSGWCWYSNDDFVENSGCCEYASTLNSNCRKKENVKIICFKVLHNITHDFYGFFFLSLKLLILIFILIFNLIFYRIHVNLHDIKRILKKLFSIQQGIKLDKNKEQKKESFASELI